MRELFQRDLRYLTGEFPPEEQTHDIQAAVERLARGHRLFDDGLFEEALRAYDEALSFVQAGPGPTSLGPMTLEAAIVASIADCRANLGRFDEALDATDRALGLLEDAGHPGRRCRRCLLMADRRAFYLAWMGRCDAAVIESAEVIDALRQLADEDADCRVDLARSLDHRAEILERAHRLEEAALAATESTALRRDMSIANAELRVPLLRSIVTLARIMTNLGRTSLAAALGAEAASLVTVRETAVPLDLRAQIATVYGRSLLGIGDHDQGMGRLLEGMTLFRQLTLASGGASVFRDAYAEVMLDLGRMLLGRDDRKASRWIVRAAAQKRHIARSDDHPLHHASHAETLIDLGRSLSNRGHTGAAHRFFSRALAILENEEILPGSLPDMLLTVSRCLIDGAADRSIDGYFPQLARLLARASEITDETYLAFIDGRVADINRLWLQHFLDADLPGPLLQLLSFAHGRRLAQLSRSEADVRARENRASRDELELIELRRRIHRLDLEMADILSARSPSVVRRPSNVAERATGNEGQPMGRAGAMLRGKRQQLFHRYVVVRDRLIAGNRFQDAIKALLERHDLMDLTRDSRAVAVWCVPEAFGVDRPPRLIVLLPGVAHYWSRSAPELQSAVQLFEALLATWRAGRSGTRGAALPVSQVGPLVDPVPVEADLWRAMDTLWSRIAAALAISGTSGVDMVTHAGAHNLPWLGSCPASIGLRQFPSLNFLVRRAAVRGAAPPTSDNPLILAIDRSWHDPLNTLYNVPLEVAALRLVWPGAVIAADDPAGADLARAAAVWIIGHGLTERGRPLVGGPTEVLPLASLGLLQRADLRVGLMYASTCHLGRTTDIDGEPVGLPSLAAVRREAPYAAGAVTPIDDLGAALIALLFNYYWRQLGSPRAAFDEARRVSATGKWPAPAMDLLEAACRSTRGEIMARAEADARVDRPTVARSFPGLAPGPLLAKQFLIRRQGQACLDLWRGSDDLVGWLATLTEESIARPGSRPASDYFSWFG